MQSRYLNNIGEIGNIYDAFNIGATTGSQYITYITNTDLILGYCNEIFPRVILFSVKYAGILLEVVNIHVETTQNTTRWVSEHGFPVSSVSLTKLLCAPRTCCDVIIRHKAR